MQETQVRSLISKDPISVQFSSVTQSCPTICDPMNRSTPDLPVHHQLPEFTQTHVHRVGDVIQASPPLSSPSPLTTQSLPVPEYFPMSQLFAWGGRSIGVSALASVLPKNTQDWSPLEWTGWISLQSKGLSRVFSNTTVQKHQFFSAQLSSQPASPNCDNQRHLQTVPDVSRGGAGCAELRAKSSGVWIHKRVSLGDSYWATSTSGPPGTIILHRAWNSKTGKEILLHIFESRPPVW